MIYVDFVWEQQSFRVPVVRRQTSDGFYVDFVTVVNSLGPKGRDELLSVLFINHRDEYQKVAKQITRIEKARFA